jgi:large subunit ribosomal protein L13
MQNRLTGHRSLLKFKVSKRWKEECMPTKSYMAKEGQVQQRWLLVDADGAVLGRLAAKIAVMLMGKDKPTWTPHVDCGDFVVVVNARRSG